MWPHSAQVKVVAVRPNHSTLRNESQPLPSSAIRLKNRVSPQTGQRSRLPRTSYWIASRLRRNMRHPTSTTPRPAIPIAGGSTSMAVIVTPANGTTPVRSAKRSAGRL